MKNAKVTRKFLNSKDGMASIMDRVTLPSKPFHEQDDAWGNSLDANLTLSDCARQVTLDFDAYDEKDIKERFRKIDLIRDALNRIEDGLIEYYFNCGVLTDAERKESRVAREKDDDHKQEARTIRVSELLEDLDNGI